MDIKSLNEKLKDYDEDFFKRLDPVLDKISEKSQALASSLKKTITNFRETDRYLKASNGENVAILEKELTEREFMIFREYVSLLRSCTIMCGHDQSEEFKNLFKEFFSGERLERAKKLGNGNS